MLLDQKKTRRMVVIVSIVCAVAFVGVLPVVLGLVVFGGGNDGGTGQLVKDAERRVRESPNDIAALVELAAQYRAAQRPQDSVTTLQKAVAIGPKTNADLQALVAGLSEQPAQQLNVLRAYTRTHPRDADALFTYGATAERVGQVVAARLAYQQAAKVAPKGSTLRDNATAALNRLKDAPIPSTPATPATPATPVTP